MSFTYTNQNDTQGFLKLQDDNKEVKKDKNFYCTLGDSFMLKNEYRKAIKEYLVSLMLDKNNYTACLGASKAYKNLKEYDKAIKHLKKARNIYGFNSEIYYELGLNYLLNADNENARKNFIRTIKLAPENKNAQVKLALTHELFGEEEMAISVYKTIIEKFPYYIPALSNLASLYMEKEDYSQAINLFRKILKINKEYYRAFLGMGICFDKLQKFSYATRYYKKYIAYKPNSQTTKSLAGRIYEIYNSGKRINKTSSARNKFKVISKPI